MRTFLRSLGIVAASAFITACTFGLLHGGAGAPPGLAAIAGGITGFGFGRSMG